MKQMRIAECKCNSLAPCSGKEAKGKIEYGKNLMKHRKIYLAVSIGCLLMAAIYYQIESHFLINGRTMKKRLRNVRKSIC